MPELVRFDRLALRVRHREHLHEDLRGLLDRVHEAEGQVKVLAGGEHAVMRPDRDVVLLHELRGRDSDVASARNHPRNHADAAGEDHRALGRHLPQLAGEGFVGQRQHEGQGDRVGRMAVIDNSVLAVRGNVFHFMVHEVARKLGGRTAAVHKAPADPVVLALVVELDDAEGVFRLDGDVAEIFSGTRHKEILARQLRNRRPDRLPLARNQLFLHGLDFLRLDAVA